jgi:tyrosine-protein kinase Etk/Wzc
VIVRAAATTLLVARFGKTSVKEMENSIKRMEQMGTHKGEPCSTTW